MPFGEQVLPPAHKRRPIHLPDGARSSEGKHPQRLPFAFDLHQTAIAERKAASGFVSAIHSLDCLQVIHDSAGKFCQHVRTTRHSEQERQSKMRRTCISRENGQNISPLPRVSAACCSYAEDATASSRAARAVFCLVLALVSLSVQNFPAESFIHPVTWAKQMISCCEASAPRDEVG